MSVPPGFFSRIREFPGTGEPLYPWVPVAGSAFADCLESRFNTCSDRSNACSDTILQEGSRSRGPDGGWLRRPPMCE